MAFAPKTMPKNTPKPKTTSEEKKPAVLKRPGAGEPSSREVVKTQKNSATAAVACVCSAWSGSDATTIASLREEIAKSIGADYNDKITVASFSADVSVVLGVDFPRLSYVAAVVGAKDKAAPQLVSRGVGAKHVYVVGEPMCLRHGCRCSLSDCAPIDVLVADGVEDTQQLVAALRLPLALAVECDLRNGIGRVGPTGWGEGGRQQSGREGHSTAREWEP